MSRNSLKHGLLRKKIRLMPDESRYLFNKFNASLIEQWKPRNAIEFMLVEQLAFNYWRLKRAYRLETEQLERAAEEAEKWRTRVHDSKQQEVYITEFLNFERFDKFSRYITSIQRQILRNLRELQKLKKGRETEFNAATVDDQPKTPIIKG